MSKERIVCLLGFYCGLRKSDISHALQEPIDEVRRMLHIGDMSLSARSWIIDMQAVRVNDDKKELKSVTQWPESSLNEFSTPSGPRYKSHKTAGGSNVAKKIEVICTCAFWRVTDHHLEAKGANKRKPEHYKPNWQLKRSSERNKKSNDKVVEEITDNHSNLKCYHSMCFGRVFEWLRDNDVGIVLSSMKAILNNAGIRKTHGLRIGSLMGLVAADYTVPNIVRQIFSPSIVRFFFSVNFFFRVFFLASSF
jgi:hypothetical protein